MTLTLEFQKPTTPDSGVYCIRNKLTNAVYVGSSVQLKKRMAEHKRTLRKGTHHAAYLQRAWTKYGEDCFEFFIMQYVTKDRVRQEEQHWLTNATCAYNSSRDATHPGHTPESCARASAALKAVWADPGRREAARQRALNQTSYRSGPLPAEHVQKLKDAHRANNRTYQAFGKVWALKELAEQYNVHYGMLKDRVRAGWDLETAVATPKRKGGL